MNSIIDIQNTLSDMKNGFVYDHDVPTLYVMHVEFLLGEIERLKKDLHGAEIDNRFHERQNRERPV